MLSMDKVCYCGKFRYIFTFHEKGEGKFLRVGVLVAMKDGSSAERFSFRPFSLFCLAERS